MTINNSLDLILRNEEHLWNKDFQQNLQGNTF